jgi:hypothetical protein
MSSGGDGNRMDRQADFIGAGFAKLDDGLLEARPPRIDWGMLYKNKPIDQRLEFAERLAAAMNHAAALIQDERDKLGALCEKKEEQLVQMAAAIRANNAMLQQEVTRMNEQRQFYNSEMARLNAELKGLKGRDNGDR